MKMRFLLHPLHPLHPTILEQTSTLKLRRLLEGQFEFEEK
jgi:hypothetical protein